MKYYIIAGEASGDLHGSNLIKALKAKDSNAQFRYWGGDLMREASGETPVKHIKELAFMGFIEVALNLSTILSNIRYCKEDIKKYQPDVLILIDYPGFNLRISRYAKSLGLKVVYYISPQLWAWKEGRVKTIRSSVDEMLVILPFEKEFYQKHGVEVHFVGHPLLDAIEHLSNVDVAEFKKANGLDEREIIALLPGSRAQEVEKMLEIMLSVREHYVEYQFVVAAAPGLDLSFYQKFATKGVSFIQGDTYNLLRVSRAALVASGTATLETALLGTPQVVCYRGSKISYEIAKRLVKNIKYISLVNLIMDREVVKELIQDELNTRSLVHYLDRILNEPKRSELLHDYQELRLKLGGPGASKKAAERILKEISMP